MDLTVTGEGPSHRVVPHRYRPDGPPEWFEVLSSPHPVHRAMVTFAGGQWRVTVTTEPLTMERAGYGGGSPVAALTAAGAAVARLYRRDMLRGRFSGVQRVALGQQMCPYPRPGGGQPVTPAGDWGQMVRLARATLCGRTPSTPGTVWCPDHPDGRTAHGRS
jgi:hypothetical protein